MKGTSKFEGLWEWDAKRNILTCDLEEVTEGWRKLHKEDFNIFYFSLQSSKVIK
jgi:hypothetical protein